MLSVYKILFLLRLILGRLILRSFGLARVELVQNLTSVTSITATCLGVDSVQRFLRENTQKLPSDIQRLEDRSGLIGALSDELLLETVQELESKLVIGRQRLFTNDSLHRSGVFSNGVLGVLTISDRKAGDGRQAYQLVGHISVVLSGKLLADSALHQPRKRGQNVDWWVNLTIVELAIDEDLSL